MSTTPDIQFESYAHINAETLLAELLANGLSADQLQITKAGAFKKLFRKDIDTIKADKDDHGRTQLKIGINRDSIYDVLPEGLFHQPVAANTSSSTSTMVSDSRRLKEEEKKARLFFQPFDHEFMLTATAVEQQERYFMHQVLGGNLSEDPYLFWDIPTDIPKEQATKLTGILPWAYLIKGNADLSAKTLQMILGKPVSLQQKWEVEQQLQYEPSKMEQMVLGEDTVLGAGFAEATYCWVFSIREIETAEMQYFTPPHHFGKLLQLFTDIFIPVETDVKFEFETVEMTESLADHILGYGFMI